LRYFNSSHNNPRHFQEDALQSFYFLHDAALSAAREDAHAPREVVEATGETRPLLMRALSYSAAADHYLEDAFAPGHVVTPRDGMHDATALSWHDAYNARGRVLAVRNWGELTDLADFLGKAAREPENSYDLAFRRVGGLRKDHVSHTPLEEALKALKASSIDQVSGKPNAGPGQRATCSYKSGGPFTALIDPFGREAPLFLDLNAALFDMLDTRLSMDEASGRESDTATRKVASAERTSPSVAPVICVRGDGSLNEQEVGQESEAAVQKVLMVLIEAKYIVQVISAFGVERYLPPQVFGVSTLADPYTETRHVWCGAESSDEQKTAAATKSQNQVNVGKTPDANANICMSLLVAARAQCAIAEEGPKGTCDTVYTIPTLASRYFAYVGTPTPSDELASGITDYRDWLIDAHAGFIAANHRTYSPVAPIVGIEAGPPLDQDPGSIFQNYAALGFAHRVGAGPDLSSLWTIRDAVQFPSIDFQIGPYTNYEDIGNGVVRRWRWGYGIRADEGFSLLTVYLVFGSEPRLYDPVRTAHGFAVGAGVSLILNGRRLTADLKSGVERLRGLFD